MNIDNSCLLPCNVGNDKGRVPLATTSGIESDDKPDLWEWPLVFAVPAGLVGLGAGAFEGSDKTFRLEGMSESALKKLLADLCAHARMPDFK